MVLSLYILRSLHDDTIFSVLLLKYFEDSKAYQFSDPSFQILRVSVLLRIWLICRFSSPLKRYVSAYIVAPGMKTSLSIR